MKTFTTATRDEIVQAQLEYAFELKWREMKRDKNLPDRRCLFAACGKLFTPTRDWQRYCCPAHRTEDFRQREFTVIEQMTQEIASLRTRNEELENRIKELEK